MDLANRKVAVIGLGKTGRAAVEFLAMKGARVAATDEKPPSQIGDFETAWKRFGEAVRLGAYGEDILSGVDLVVPSPGVPPANPILMAAVRKGVPILSELEIAARFLRIPMIAITGTNGKTTTTTLTGHIFRESGQKVFVGGNIGSPLIGYVGGPQDDDYAVVEVSSFQLQWAETFRPHVAALLNTTCDHVDYHGSFQAYREAKEKIFACQGPEDFAILNADEQETAALAEKLPATVVRFSSSSRIDGIGVFMEAGGLAYRPSPDVHETYPLEMIKIPGRHNIENVMVALAIARICGCGFRDIIDSVAAFKGIAHRIEFVGKKRDVAFYDDSKGTNVDAVKRALETFSAPVVLLLGGRDKAGDFESLIPSIREKVKQLIIFGEARERIHHLIGDIVAVQITPTLGEGISAAYNKALAGDVVLLSPGCASFDEFKDYKDRGQFFRKTVEGLPDV